MKRRRKHREKKTSNFNWLKEMVLKRPRDIGMDSKWVRDGGKVEG